jgi:hypothetical protein
MSNTFRKQYRELSPKELMDREDIINYAVAIEEILSMYKSREASLAMTNLEQAVMWASKAIST